MSRRPVRAYSETLSQKTERNKNAVNKGHTNDLDLLKSREQNLLKLSLLHDLQKTLFTTEVPCPDSAAAQTGSVLSPPCFCCLYWDSDPIIFCLQSWQGYSSNSLYLVSSLLLNTCPFKTYWSTCESVTYLWYWGTQLPGLCNQASTLPLSHNPVLSI